MSIWCHVAAVVRIDDLRWDDSTPDFEEIFGKTCKWGSSDDVWNDLNEHSDKYLPCGSEGSLEMSVWKNPDISCMAAYTVSIFGDLRDFADGQGVVDWFKNKLKDIFVRQACITVLTEGNKPITWTYSDEEEGV